MLSQSVAQNESARKPTLLSMAMMRTKIRALPISATAQSVFLALFEWYGADAADVMWRPNEDLSTDTKKSVRTVSRAMRELRAKHVIEPQRVCIGRDARHGREFVQPVGGRECPRYVLGSAMTAEFRVVREGCQNGIRGMSKWHPTKQSTVQVFQNHTSEQIAGESVEGKTAAKRKRQSPVVLSERTRHCLKYWQATTSRALNKPNYMSHKDKKGLERLFATTFAAVDDTRVKTAIDAFISSANTFVRTRRFPLGIFERDLKKYLPPPATQLESNEMWRKLGRLDLIRAVHIPPPEEVFACEPFDPLEAA